MAKKKSKKKAFIIFGILLIILFAGSYFLFFKGTNKAVNVTIAKVERKTISQTVSAIGKIEPETEIKISSETSGEIIMLAVKEGDTVKNGRLLVKIKPDIIESQLEQVKSAADAAKTDIDAARSEKVRAEQDLKRITELFNKEFSSKQELDASKSTFERSVSGLQSAESRYQQALATYRQIQKTASRTTIFSPINGIITSLSIEQGEKVVGTAQMAGTEMMRVSDLSVMNAMVDVDENDIVLVKIGDTATIEVDAVPDREYKGVVVEMGHSAIVNALGSQDQVTNFKVKIRIIDRDEHFRPGMSCNVEIQTQTKTNVLAIPLQSVTVREDIDMEKMKGDDNKVKKQEDEKKDKFKRPPSVVFIKDGSKVKQRTVKTGISDKGYIEITEGLKEGETIISGNYMAVSKQLKDGSMIKVDSTQKFKKKK